MVRVKCLDTVFYNGRTYAPGSYAMLDNTALVSKLVQAGKIEIAITTSFYNINQTTQFKGTPDQIITAKVVQDSGIFR